MQPPELSNPVFNKLEYDMIAGDRISCASLRPHSVCACLCVHRHAQGIQLLTERHQAVATETHTHTH